MLASRGKAIKKNDKDKVKNIERSIEKFIQSSPECLTKPKAAFVTFEYTDAVNLLEEMVNE
jgi:hypothetical protein